MYHTFLKDQDIMYANAVDLYKQNKLDKALKILDQIMESNPVNDKAAVIKGHILLLRGDPEGWELVERWRRDQDPEHYERDYQHKWKGNKASNLIVLRDDQGIGDCVQHLRYIPLVQQLCSKLILTIKPELEPLVAYNFPKIPRTPYRIENGMQIVRCDKNDLATLQQMPITGLGAMFKTIPNSPYLKADTMGNGGIGFCWYSGSHWHNFAEKSIPFPLIHPLLKKTNGISLQHEDLQTDNFLETAAIINGLDLIITVDTAIAHVAGALGKPVWVLLQKNCDFRWGRKGTTSPWYSTAKLFRQKDQGDWKPVLKQVENLL